jgi:Uma2 family endonuclease
MSLRKRDVVAVIEYPETDGEPMAETDLHRQLMTDLIAALEGFFQSRPDVYVSGNLLLYYVKGNPSKRVAPDVFVVRGVKKGPRRIYKLWEEGRAPAIVIELSSRKTWREDLYTKLRLYEQLGVAEYFIFDPEYDYLPEPLLGWQLKDGEYVPLEVKEGRVRSKALRLDLVDTGETLRLCDPQTEQYLPIPAEEIEARLRAEAEVARLGKELEKLRQPSSSKVGRKRKLSR